MEMGGLLVLHAGASRWVRHRPALRAQFGICRFLTCPCVDLGCVRGAVVLCFLVSEPVINAVPLWFNTFS